VREARTSHGTFYLYFANKEDLLAALAAECAVELRALTEHLPEDLGGPEGEEALAAFVAAFLTTYRTYAGVIRAWMEGHVVDAATNRLGVRTFTHIADRLERRLPRGVRGQARRAQAAALMALLERSAYALVSRHLAGTDEAATTLARLVHRGFFAPVG